MKCFLTTIITPFNNSSEGLELHLWWGESESASCSVLSDSSRSHGLYCPWNSPGKNTGVGCHFFLQGIFPTQGSNLGLPHWRQILYHLCHLENSWWGSITINDRHVDVHSVLRITALKPQYFLTLKSQISGPFPKVNFKSKKRNPTRLKPWYSPAKALRQRHFVVTLTTILAHTFHSGQHSVRWSELSEQSSVQLGKCRLLGPGYPLTRAWVQDPQVLHTC